LIPEPGLAAGAFLALLLSLLSYRLRFLTRGGAAVQWLMGATLLGVGGWQWTLPILTFFLLSSFLSRIRTEQKLAAETSYSKNSRRDALQVLANGGVPWMTFMLFLLLHEDFLYVAHVGSIAAAAADTWGTEIGTLSGQQPRLLTTFERADAGRSGAVTAAGSAAGIAGAVIVGFPALLWIESPTAFVVAVTLGGTLGSAVDSLAGAVLQAQWRCAKCDRITEQKNHCEVNGRLERGYARISNDTVNILCTLSGALFSPFFQLLLP